MSVIIRLQNLPWSANASDVRGFFRGLGIPDGGVHIVGGENGDAFIAFSTDEDARQAMMMNGSKLKETQVHLLLSSRAEMQKVIETARQQTMSFMNFSAQQPTATVTPSIPVIAPQISIPGIQTQSSILNGSNAVVGLMDPHPQLAIAKPQPPIITSSSLSGILAQQMLQQHQIQLMRQQQNMPVLTSTSVRHDTYKSMNNQYNSMGHQYGDSSMDNGKNTQGNDSKRSRNSRSRSRSRDRRDRRRSRSRERSRRYRDRSRSRERRRRSRRSPSSDRRSRSRGRDRSSRDNARKDRSYDKDVRSSLDRNKIPDVNNSISSNVINVNNASAGTVEQHKPFNYTDAGAANNNFNSAPIDDRSNVAFNNFSNPTRNDYPTKTMNDFDPAVALVPFKDPNNSMNCGSCIRITNMNNRTHYAAIRKFFYGLQIPNDGIKLLNDETGKRTNDVVIRFARPDIAHDALALDGKMLNGNTVRITSVGDAEYENEVDSFQPPRRNASRFGNRYDDRNYGGDRGGSEENNRDRRNNRDRNDRGHRRSRFNDDSDGHGNQSNDSRDRHGDDDDVMLITDSNDGETMPVVGLTLLIEDLPPFAKEQDIIKMFSDFTLMDIMLAKVNKAFRAYVKFHNQNDAEAALKQTHLHRIDFKSVFVSPCSDATYDKAKQEYDGIGDLTSKPEFIAHEPNSSDRDANDDFRNNSSEADNEVDQFGRSIRNRKFVNQQPQQQQSVPDNKSQIPSLFNLTFDPPFMASQQPEQKFVPADPRLRRQFDQNNAQSSPDSQLSPNQQPKTFNPFNQQGRLDPRLQRNASLPLPNLTNNINSKIVFIGNVEYNTTEGDIVGFFADIGAVPEGVFFVKNARGQPCGDCYVKFKSADEATRALIKNRFRFRSRVIRVTLAEGDDASKVLGFSLSDDGDVTNHSNDNAIESSNKGSLTEDFASEKNDKTDKGQMDIDGSNAGSQNAERDGDDGQNDDDGNGGNQFSREDPRMMYNAPYARGGNIGDRAGNVMNMGNNNYVRGRGGASDNRDMRGNNSNNNNYNRNNNQRNLDGCIVSLNNVPFAATPRDIADFFGEYNLTPDDIIRRYNDDGTLTGEARVRFLTPIDASEAIERHQRERIRNRVIHLRLVT